MRNKNSPTKNTVTPNGASRASHPAPADLKAADVKAADLKARRLAAQIDEWLNDDSGYDEQTWPGLKSALEADRLSRRRLFSE